MQAQAFGFLDNGIYKGAFKITLPASATTSAAVYKSGTTLVKTIWNTELLSAGTHTRYWNGTDDYGRSITPEETYTLRVVTHNVQYEWQGTLGNTSDNMTGETKHRGYYHCIKGLDFNTQFGYFCTGYSEGSPSVGKFEISTPNTKINMYGSLINTGDVNFVCADENIAYWAAYDPANSRNNWVWGTTVSADTEFPFVSGITNYKSTHSKTYTKVISLMTGATTGTTITGMGVQRSGNYLLVARGGINELKVYDKVTGGLVQTLSYTDVEYPTFDRSDNLWMVVNNVAGKYVVNGDGTITGPSITLSGLSSQVLGLGVSWDGSVVAACDGNQVNNVKYYNNNTGVLFNTFGISGGYYTNATVSNTKFYFTDLYNTTSGQRGKQPFVVYQPDNTMWINDPGNFRCQRFTSGGTWLDRIMSLGSSYATWVDKTDTTRVFCEYLEFGIDYSVQTLTGLSGWTLTKNWGANFWGIWDPSYKIRLQATLPNGRTFCLGRVGSGHNLIELTQTGSTRLSAATWTDLNRILCADGSLQTWTLVGDVGTLKHWPVTGYTALGTPIWSGTGQTLAVMTRNTVTGSTVSGPQTECVNRANGKIIWHNANVFADGVSAICYDYHLGVQLTGTTDFLWKSEKPTQDNYQGPYPSAGWFEAGNGVKNPGGGNMNFVGRYILTSYHGEFWKNAQTNYYNLYLDNGLSLGQFGTDRAVVGAGNHAYPELAGNALVPCMVSGESADCMYVYHGDESDHAGVHRWKITNLSSITETETVIPFPVIYQDPPRDYLDLLSGLTWDSVLSGTSSGWTKNPDTVDYRSSSTLWWEVRSSYYQYNPQESPDIYMKFAQTGTTEYYVYRDLGTNDVTNSWKITGTLDYRGGVNVTTNKNFAYIEVLDDADKVLTTMHGLVTYTVYPAGTIKYIANTKTLFNLSSTNVLNSNAEMAVFLEPKHFEVSIVNSAVTFTYAGYTTGATISDATANWRKPKTLRVRINSNGGGPNTPLQIDMAKLKFYKDYI